MTQLLPPKKEVALALLERSNVDVYLDPRAKGVVVPPQFRKEPRLILKIGLNMPVPIPDLRLDDESMSCTLSFNRAKFFCVVPWLSVFAMVGDDGRGMVWPDDVPQELAVRVVDDRSKERDGAGREAETPPSSRGAGKNKPRVAPDLAPAPESSSPSERGNGRKGRGKKKKEEPARPVLVAVPSPEKSASRLEKLDERRERPAAPPPTPRIGGAAGSGAAAAGPGGTGGAGGAAESGRAAGSPPARPKRELPPYLRVVK